MRQDADRGRRSPVHEGLPAGFPLQVQTNKAKE